MLQNKTRVPPKLFAIKEESFSLLAREDRAPPASEKKSPLPHPRQEETESFLQRNETKESSISISIKQTRTAKLSRKKRAPLTLQSARRHLLISI